MFRGSSYHTIDDKGRIVIPSRFRELIRSEDGEGLMISRMDRCLVAFPMSSWVRLEERILKLAEKSEVMRRFRRVFIGGAHECVCDKQDRLLIPPALRQYAGLNKEIVLVGVLDHFEIWSRENYENEELMLANDLKDPEARNEIAKLGI
ncbi:MAG: division/cell wall cluster transcriptional repressor MraZ [Desulfobacterales bacterium]